MFYEVYKDPENKHTFPSLLDPCFGRVFWDAGAPSDLVNYFHFVAEEVRAGLAAAGYRSLNDLIGRADSLRQRPGPLAKTAGLDLSFLTTYVGTTGSSNQRLAAATHDNGPQLDDEILADPEVQVGDLLKGWRAQRGFRHGA